MKIIQTLSTILLVVLASCGGDGDNEPTGPAGDADVSGTWTLSATVVVDGSSSCSYDELTLDLVPGGASSTSGGTITCGTSNSSMPDLDVGGPIVDGTRVVFSMGTVIYDGTVNGNSMSGIITDDDEDVSLSGGWSAVKQ